MSLFSGPVAPLTRTQIALLWVGIVGGALVSLGVLLAWPIGYKP